MSYFSVRIDKPDGHNKKPDFIIGTQVKSKEIYFFFVEIKRPDTSSKYQAEDDHVKLMKQMKSSVCDQLCLGVKNPTSLGILVEGYRCTLYQTRVVADGIYIPMAFKRFSLVEEMYDLVHLPSIVEGLFFVKTGLETFLVEVHEKRKREEKRAGKEHVCSSICLKKATLFFFHYTKKWVQHVPYRSTLWNSLFTWKI